MKLRDIVLEQLHHHETEVVPYSLKFDDEGVDLRLDAHFDSPAWRERLEPFFITCGQTNARREEHVSDTHVRDAYGAVWRTDLRPWHLEETPLKVPSFEGYDFPTIETIANPHLEETAKKMLHDYPDSFALLELGMDSRVGGLWESCWMMRGFENAMMDCVAEVDFFEELLDRLMDLFLAQVDLCKNIPADGFFLFDDWGDQRGVMIGPERWRKFFKPRYARIYEEIHAQGKYIISHCCGSPADLMPDIIEIGLDVLESVQPEAKGMNPYNLKKKWGEKISFWGGLGSQSTIPWGTPAEIHAEVRKLRREMGKGGGYVLAPAKALQPETTIENAIAVLDALTNPN